MLVEITSKIVLIGDIAVGKTSIVRRYTTNEYTDHHYVTVGVDYLLKYNNIINNNIDYKIGLQLWDTAGLERFRSITKMYYTGSSYCIIVFDMSNIESFHNAINMWLNDVKEFNPNSVILLVGNKYDIATNKLITTVDKWIDENRNIIFFKTSLKDRNSINNIFDFIMNDIIYRFNNNSLLEGTRMRNSTITTNNNYINIDNNKKKNTRRFCWC
jgi:small GTP-binding protein